MWEQTKLEDLFVYTLQEEPPMKFNHEFTGNVPQQMTNPNTKRLGSQQGDKYSLCSNSKLFSSTIPKDSLLMTIIALIWWPSVTTRVLNLITKSFLLEPILTPKLLSPLKLPFLNRPLPSWKYPLLHCHCCYWWPHH